MKRIGRDVRRGAEYWKKFLFWHFCPLFLSLESSLLEIVYNILQ